MSGKDIEPKEERGRGRISSDFCGHPGESKGKEGTYFVMVGMGTLASGRNPWNIPRSSSHAALGQSLMGGANVCDWLTVQNKPE